MSQYQPPGKIKILDALSRLLEQKNFNAVTTANIAREAGVTEGLIYKYFRDKKDLLFELLGENLTIFHRLLTAKIMKKETTVEKLKIFILTTIRAYLKNRVFSRILLLEVRNSPEYFQSNAHAKMMSIESFIHEIIINGMARGELKKNIDSHVLLKVMVGAIEHACLDAIIFNQDINTSAVTDLINDIIFKGIEP
ncbi:transcriptional regulator, TetR family [Desulfocicer vacuolatum DSM 3385]|uniref:Transcriptional regulator, TetR family n=1 Tax=Desulfocicer vacuolatum DSM 3385 TaxID=1121400 RepID=A0A1W2AIQ1_9BACT|nr:TetR/AcrR family transcriptional regulator [Desulfocicer vacuolatum]SMC60128.1 transcriptional regulator, TetR family [Desulfocicer vacuolatum DSM 3385]